MKIFYDHKLLPLARQLRTNSTLSEVLLWNGLKAGNIKGYQFMRQKPIGDYIVDFYCSKLNLAIEIDGDTHHNKIDDDQLRQQELEKTGVSFLRFQDADVKKNIDGVFRAIELWIGDFERNNPLPPFIKGDRKENTPLTPVSKGDRKLHNNHGFSLLEAIMTSVAITVVGAIVIYALAAGITTYAAARDREDDGAPLRIAAARLARDLREIKSPSAVVTAAPAQLAYLDLCGRAVTYQFANGILRRNGQPVLADIVSFQFIYRDRAGAPVAAPAVAPNPSDIRSVGAEVALNPGEMKETIEISVCPRMLRE